MTWKQIALIAGGATAASLVLYYLLREEPAECSEASRELKDVKKVNVNEVTKEQVLEILRDIIKSQDQMKHIMKDLTQELIKNKYNFEKTYSRVKDVQPDDPLERYGLSMGDFDQLLDKHQHDPHIRDAIARIMGAPGPNGVSPTSTCITKQTIVKVHDYMLQELRKLVEEFQKMPSKNDYEMKTVTIAAQALVGARVEEHFSLTSEDIESAVLMHHESLACDIEFARINVQMQNTMTQLMGGQFSGYC